MKSKKYILNTHFVGTIYFYSYIICLRVLIKLILNRIFLPSSDTKTLYFILLIKQFNKLLSK